MRLDRFTRSGVHTHRMGGRRFGVEEEFLLVHPVSGAPVGVSGHVVRQGSGGAVAKELQQEQVETGTAPVLTLDGLGAEIARLRLAAAAEAGAAGARLAALATSPIAVDPSVTTTSRYQRMVQLYGLAGSDQLVCGLHVHVETQSPDEAVGALDRIRPWLPVLLALSANSPYWHGADSGYQSYRTQAWSRWPTAGPSGTFGSLPGYRATVAAMVATEGVLDDGMVYFDARLGHDLPTLEVRVADVCTAAEDTVLIAALTRALVDTAARSWQRDEPEPQVRTEVLRLASWRASRVGVTDRLVHPVTSAVVPAWDAVAALRAYVAESLAGAGDSAMVDGLLDQVRSRGTGAAAQRASYQRRGRLADVVQDAVRRTVEGL